MDEPVSKRVCVEIEVNIEFDKSLMPDDEWRSQFYRDIKTENDLAQHFAVNAVLNGVRRLTQLDGFADRDNSLLSIEIDRDVCMEVSEV